MVNTNLPYPQCETCQGSLPENSHIPCHWYCKDADLYGSISNIKTATVDAERK